MKHLWGFFFSILLLFSALSSAQEPCEDTFAVYYNLKAFDPSNITMPSPYPYPPFFRQDDYLILSELEIRADNKECQGKKSMYNFSLYLITPEKERLPLCNPENIDIEPMQANEIAIITHEKFVDETQSSSKYNITYSHHQPRIQTLPNQCYAWISQTGDWKIEAYVDGKKLIDFYWRGSLPYTTRDSFRVASHEEIVNLELQNAIKWLAWTAILVAIVVGGYQISLMNRQEKEGKRLHKDILKATSNNEKFSTSLIKESKIQKQFSTKTNELLDQISQKLNKKCRCKKSATKKKKR